MDIKSYFKSNRLLAVEGRDECNFFDQLLKHENIAAVQVLDIGGKDKFPNAFAFLHSRDGFNNLTVIGFVRDAEEKKAATAFQSICSVLRLSIARAACNERNKIRSAENRHFHHAG